MDVTPYIFNAQVMHKRIFPRENSFTYRIYYLALPLPARPVQTAFLRFDPKDVGHRDGSDPELYARSILADYGFSSEVTHIMLITMPRVLGYVFNPVSFYFCLDESKLLRAVIAEVHNTFGEQHSYLCARPDQAPIDKNLWMEAQKLFHVSPFLQRNGHYRFRFAMEENKLGIWIDYFDKDKNRQLLTSLTGHLNALNNASLRRAFWVHPLVTLKTIMLIHWQAIKLMAKRTKYITKPEQYENKISATESLQKCKDSERPE